MNTIEKRIKSVQSFMESHDLDALYISGTDVHLGEYVSDRYRSREWITGFTGSAGTVVVTRNETHLWVDSRYYLQGALQTENTPVILERLGDAGVLDPFDWIRSRSDTIRRIGLDKTTLSVASYRVLKKILEPALVEIVLLDDFLEELWVRRPENPFSTVVEMNVEIAGESRGHKIGRIRDKVKSAGADATIISTLDDIAWITNLRGGDLPHTPVFFSYLIITSDEVILCTDESRFDTKLLQRLFEEITVVPYRSVMEHVERITSKGLSVYISDECTTMEMYEKLGGCRAVIEGANFSTLMKAKKNEVEVEGMRRAHYLDGLALVKFLHHLDTNDTEDLTEISIARLLEDYRKESEEYLGPSFAPIAGFGPHGAMEHYSATSESCSVLQGDTLLVLDTGGQYESGTTDITRTLALNGVSDQMKRDYTLVLKGNLALSAARFPKGTKGYQLDVLARQFLWQSGLSYGHGTGHGVGHRLNVHEGPQNISPRTLQVPLEPGMVLSDEPGLYRKGEYGIRIENLVTVFEEAVTSYGPFYTFEVLTLCPFERKLIDVSLLNTEEIAMLNAYHGWVYSELSRELNDDQKEWLKEVTLPIEQ
ncbi:MAG: aminopeptidase P family protein [Sphaerochaetaceae bacterium]|nr:aminopeptidase P family protein [Sphaerochaetaceae bacterium]